MFDSKISIFNKNETQSEITKDTKILEINNKNSDYTNKIPVITVRNLCMRYNKADDLVLKNINLEIFSDSVTAIMGPSRSGKSTLLNCISALEKPSEGSVKVFDKEITLMKEPALTKFRRKNINFIFQQYNLIDSLSVIDNIKLPYKLSGEKTHNNILASLIQNLGLKGKENKLPSSLSGGQQQRVAIARALLGKNRIIFADEPTGALDIKNGTEALNLLISTSKTYSLPLVIVTHDPAVAAKCDLVYFLSDGNFLKTLYCPDVKTVSEKMLNLQKQG